MILVYGFLDFVDESLNPENPPAPYVDVMVVLTGGRGRADKGMELLRGGKGRVLLLSGVDKEADVDSIFFPRPSYAERSNMILEKSSTSTYENALEVRRFMEENGFHSVALITNAYHMKRALYLFKRVMPLDFSITSYRVEGSNFDASSWRKGRGFVIAWLEFFKYWWYYYRFEIEEMFGF